MILFLMLACNTPSPPASSSAGGDEIPEGQTEDDFGPAPVFLLTDQDGKTRTHADFLGKVWVANFIFTTCKDVCPRLTAHMAEVQQKYPWASYVSFSVDPTNDTPPVLLAYAQHFHAQPGWSFLTGPVADVRRVVVDGFKQAMDTRAVGPGEPDRVIHGERFVVVDKAGHMRGFPEAQSPELGALLERLR